MVPGGFLERNHRGFSEENLGKLSEKTFDGTKKKSWRVSEDDSTGIEAEAYGKIHEQIYSAITPRMPYVGSFMDSVSGFLQKFFSKVPLRFLQ